MAEPDDDTVSLAIFICQELGFVWAEQDGERNELMQDDFIRVATKIIELQKPVDPSQDKS